MKDRWDKDSRSLLGLVLFALLSFGSGFRVQGSGVRWRLRRLFLEDGNLASQPSPLGEGLYGSGFAAFFIEAMPESGFLVTGYS